MVRTVKSDGGITTVWELQSCQQTMVRTTNMSILDIWVLLMAHSEAWYCTSCDHRRRVCLGINQFTEVLHTGGKIGADGKPRVTKSTPKAPPGERRGIRAHMAANQRKGTRRNRWAQMEEDKEEEEVVDEELPSDDENDDDYAPKKAAKLTGTKRRRQETTDENQTSDREEDNHAPKMKRRRMVKRPRLSTIVEEEARDHEVNVNDAPSNATKLTGTKRRRQEAIDGNERSDEEKNDRTPKTKRRKVVKRPRLSTIVEEEVIDRKANVRDAPETHTTKAVEQSYSRPPSITIHEATGDWQNVNDTKTADISTAVKRPHLQPPSNLIQEPTDDEQDANNAKTANKPKTPKRSYLQPPSSLGREATYDEQSGHDERRASNTRTVRRPYRRPHSILNLEFTDHEQAIYNAETAGIADETRAVRRPYPLAPSISSLEFTRHERGDDNAETAGTAGTANKTRAVRRPYPRAPSTSSLEFTDLKQDDANTETANDPRAVKRRRVAKQADGFAVSVGEKNDDVGAGVPGRRSLRSRRPDYAEEEAASDDEEDEARSDHHHGAEWEKSSSPRKRATTSRTRQTRSMSSEPAAYTPAGQGSTTRHAGSVVEELKKHNDKNMWTQAEKDKVHELMNEVISEGLVNHTEQRWSEISTRLAAHNMYRSWGAIKNMWNREGRAAYGVDERRKPNPGKMVTGAQTDRKRKRT